MWIVRAIILAFSLCADCFAVTACSAVTMKALKPGRILFLAFVFGCVQTLLMLLGWLFGDIFVGHIHGVARVLGFLLLAYVGGSMILQAVKGDGESVDLEGFRNVSIAALATSIDAFTVGAGLSLGSEPFKQVAADLSALFVVTMLSVAVGLCGGSRIGRRFGGPSEIAGGIVLILIGLNMLLGIV